MLDQEGDYGKKQHEMKKYIKSKYITNILMTVNMPDENL